MTKKEQTKLGEIKPHPDNPRQHTPEQIEKIARSIKELGWGRPIILSKDGYVLAGHGAYEAAYLLGYHDDDYVPTRHMKHQHDSMEAKAYMIADNRLTDLSGWDYTTLDQAFEDIKLQGFDVTLTGFPKEMLDDDADFVLPDEGGPEFDESIKDDVQMLKCPKCGHEFPK